MNDILLSQSNDYICRVQRQNDVSGYYDSGLYRVFVTGKHFYKIILL